MNTNFKGLIHSSEGLKQSEKGTKYIKFNVLVPGYVDQFGEKRGKDQVYPITAIAEKTEHLVNLGVNDKVDVKVFINSDEFIDKNGITQYGIKFVLSEIKKIQ